MEYRKYAQIWTRYLNVIRILLKKSLQGEQTLNLDKGDFEKVGTRKSGYKFRIEFVNGRVNNRISDSEMASELSVVMQENEGVRNILLGNEFVLELNSRYQLKITCPNAPAKPEPVKEKKELPAEPETEEKETEEIPTVAEAETPVKEEEEPPAQEAL